LTGNGIIPTQVLTITILNNLDPHKLAKNIHLDHHKSIVKILILTANDMKGFARKLSNIDVVVHRHHKEELLDISPNNIYKLAALKQLNIHKGEYVAFGNDANDIDMFKDAAHSVMISFHEELSKYATESISYYEAKIFNKLFDLAKKYNPCNITT
jgi:hydroxymethylpyrimidine pyrophosphatase-like HAD family hydrolase